MERSSKNSARPIPATTRNPRTPVTTVSAAGAAASDGHGLTLSRIAGEQVVLRQSSIHHRPGEVIILGRPGRLLDLQSGRRTSSLRVDLGGVRDQRLVADARRSRAHGMRVVISQLRPVSAVLVSPALEPLRVRGLQPAPLHLLVQRGEPGLVERDEVVQLERLPRLAGARVAVGVGGGVERLHRDLVGHHVIGVRVAAVLVVGQHHVRPELAHRLDQRLGGDLQRLQREAALRQRRQRISLGQAGVDEAEELLPDAEDLAGPGHLRPPDAARSARISGRSMALLSMSPRSPPVRVQTMTSAPAADVTRHRRRALARLVVRVRVHRHQPQPWPAAGGRGRIVRHGRQQRPPRQRGRAPSRAGRAPKGAPARQRRKIILHDNRW